MQADEARSFVGGEWTIWRNLDSSNLLDVPSGYGVYIIRVAQGQIPRLSGHSDIIYVGQGKLSDRLGKCLNCKLGYRTYPYESGRLCRIEKDLKLRMEFSHLRSTSSQRLERDILDEYEKHHYELPPLNQQRGRMSKLPY
jgi:hypothetical protein